MKNASELFLGFTDAQNYLQRPNKQAFNEIFVKNDYLEKLLRPNVFFLLGEKGTGKTAYATFLSNNNYKECKASTVFISATDYEKFHRLKANHNLDLSGYTSIWRVILLLLLSKRVLEKDVLSRFDVSNIGKLNKAIDEYYNNAFSPEITKVMKIMDESEAMAKLISKMIGIGGSNKARIEYSETRFQHNLYYIERQFLESLSKLKLKNNIVLFIDGIDIRPNMISYDNYLECIKGLADAVWSLNTTEFQNFRDSKGVFRVVLLLRPDIFSSLNMQNATNKLSDNAVFLDWRTTYQDYNDSYLYEVAKKILINQQNYNEDVFEYYFPWRKKGKGRNEEMTAFMDFLRISLSRPRDVLRIMQILQEIMRRKMPEASCFMEEVFDSDEFQNMYSEYFMSSLKDQLSFYYSDSDFEHFIKFFDYFDNPEFTYDEYSEKYDQYTEYILDNAKEIPLFTEDKKELLQLLYDSNIVVAVEDNGKFFHFSYREKNNANITPRVSIGNNIKYRFHYGMYKKTKLGRY